MFCFSLSLFWILFQVDSLSPPLLFDLVGIYHVTLPAEYFFAFSCCLDCCVWGGLSVCWKFAVPLYFGGSSLWVGLDEWLVKVSWLGKLASVFWWVELDLFSLLLKRMGCLSGCLVFSAIVQKLFCGICSAFSWSSDEFVGEKVISPSYYSAILVVLFKFVTISLYCFCSMKKRKLFLVIFY